MRRNSLSTPVARAAVALAMLMIAYFSIVSTLTIARVGALESALAVRDERVRDNEKTLAVVIEKVRHIEAIVTEIRETLRDDARHGPGGSR